MASRGLATLSPVSQPRLLAWQRKNTSPDPETIANMAEQKPDGPKVTKISAAHSRNPAADGCDEQVEYIRSF